ncbi:MAG: hypothetical protein D6690_03600 [Nitrospirae bacterium]|nr:MAG: hypothetical protein D6690_03600 [Nitrospirota bacterium]
MVSIMRREGRAIICGFLVLWGTTGMGLNAQSKDLTSENALATLHRIDAAYAKIHDLQADFVQETRIAGFTTTLTSSGRVYLQKPGRLRWEYVEPTVEQILVEGDAWSMYVPQHQQVVKGKVTNLTASKAPVALLQGVGKLAEQFDVVPPAPDLAQRDDLIWLTLIPKPHEREHATVTKIVVGVDPQTWLIRQLILHEASGNISTFRFTNIAVNRGLSAEVFTLAVPDDVVVVDAPTF